MSHDQSLQRPRYHQRHRPASLQVLNQDEASVYGFPILADGSPGALAQHRRRRYYSQNNMMSVYNSYESGTLNA